jgi:putative heme-binding domain-containing protein
MRRIDLFMSQSLQFPSLTLFRSLAQLAIFVPALVPMVGFERALAQEPAPKVYRQAALAAPIQGVAQIAANANAQGASLKDRMLKEGGRPSWIWGENPDTRYVIRKSFEVSSKTQAWLAASADNAMAVTLNGKSLGKSDAWEQGLKLDASDALVVGKNELTFEVSNTGGVAALVAKLAWVDVDGKVQTVSSDASWQVAPKDKPNETKGAKLIAKYGDGPWGEVLDGQSNGSSSEFAIPPGFVIDQLFQVPKDELGSWVCITSDPKGRLIVSDQDNKGLFRVTPAKPGTQEETIVERIPLNISSAQGLLCAFDSLYVCVNGGIGSGLYRLKDTDGDDQYDEIKKLKDLRGGGEHGPHALRLSPDGKSIYVCCGNHTQPPMDRKTNAPPQTMGGARNEQLQATLPEGYSSRLVPNWDEDLLLPRQWDANGHAAGIVAPGGWIAKTDPEGKEWEMFSIGYRNQYDFDFDSAGEMFVYDADMEWDMGTPWYRPTRVVHATSGSEFGWRSGTGKWPEYYVDSLPALVNIGPGSPVGVEFGTGAKFPAKYQRALYICDWTFGTMYAIHTEPNGASYSATKEEFLSRTPLPLTDVTIGNDGHMYFTAGGRGTQSELYRVRYVGPESTTPAANIGLNDATAQRRTIEGLHNTQDKDDATVANLVKQLGSTDRHVRYAARVALERVPTSRWAPMVLKSTDANTVITGVAGLARVGNPELKEPLLMQLGTLQLSAMSVQQRLALVRAVQLVLIRLGQADDSLRDSLLGAIEPLFPSGDDLMDRELAILLTYLQSPTLGKKALPLLAKDRKKTEADFAEILQRNKGYGGPIAAMLQNQPDLQQFHLAFSMRNLKEGWGIDQRKEYFQWFEKAQRWQGGNSYEKFLINAANDAYALSSDQERFVLEALGVRKPAPLPKTLPEPKGPGKAYTTEALAKLASERMKGRNFENGKSMYAAARCVICHRFGGDGGATGPDLTQAAGRFAINDLIDALVRPSQVISDQYKTMVLQMEDGTVHTGRIVNDVAGKVTIVVNPEDATKTVTVDRKDIEQEKTSAISLMPAELMDKLNEDEALDLIAYLLSRGNPKAPMFQSK